MTPGTFRLETCVGANGKVEFIVPCAEGTKVEIFVTTPGADDFSDLVAASTSSLDFWSNPLDDEDWNDA